MSVDPYLSNFGEKLKNTRKNCHFENLIKLKKNMDEMSEVCHIDIFINLIHDLRLLGEIWHTHSP